MPQILQVRLQQYVNHELSDVQANLEKAEEPEIKLPTSIGLLKKQESSPQNLFLLYWLWQAFDCVDHSKLWKILQEMEIPDHLTFLLRNLYAGQEAAVRTGHGTMDWFQIAKGVAKALYGHLAYLIYMQSTSCEIPGCVNHKVESRLLGEISTTSDKQIPI